MRLLPTCNKINITSLESKLSSFLGAISLSKEWYFRAAATLRGGDGGEHGYLIYKIVRQKLLDSESCVCLDVGTARGFSSIVMSRAIFDEKKNGQIYTIDIVDHRKSINWHRDKQKDDEPLSNTIISREKIWNKWFQQESLNIFPITGKSLDVLKDWKYGSIDVVFLDGCHQYQTVKNELLTLAPLMQKEGIIILDDYYVGEVVGTIPILKFFTRVMRAIFKILYLSRKYIPIGIKPNNDFLLVRQKFYGIKAAVHEFIEENHEKWNLEIVTMPPRSKYQNKDQGLAILKRISKKEMG